MAAALIDALEASDVDYALGGALALAAWSEPRATKDVDVTVWVDDETIEHAFDVLSAAGVALDRAAATQQARDRGMFVGRLHGYRVDVFVPSIPFYDAVLTRRARLTVLDRRVWVLDPSSLAVFKMLFFRPKDLVDVARLVEVCETVDAAFVRRWLVDIVGADDPRVTRWDSLLAT